MRTRYRIYIRGGQGQPLPQVEDTLRVVEVLTKGWGRAGSFTACVIVEAIERDEPKPIGFLTGDLSQLVGYSAHELVQLADHIATLIEERAREAV